MVYGNPRACVFLETRILVGMGFSSYKVCFSRDLFRNLRMCKYFYRFGVPYIRYTDITNYLNKKS